MQWMDKKVSIHPGRHSGDGNGETSANLLST